MLYVVKRLLTENGNEHIINLICMSFNGGLFSCFFSDVKSCICRLSELIFLVQSELWHNGIKGFIIAQEFLPTGGN